MTGSSLQPVAAGALQGLAERVASDLRERSARVLEAARRVRKQSDAEAIHDLRVGTRRLAAALEVWSAALDPDRLEAAQSALRRIRRRLGRIREREVLLDTLTRMSEAEPELAEALEAECARASRRVARGRAGAARFARPVRLDRLTERLERAIESARCDPTALLRSAESRVDERRRAALHALALARGAVEPADLHPARVAVKKWRYAEESLALARRAPEGLLGTLRGFQQTLGAVNDAVVMRNYLSRRADRQRSKGRPARATSLERAAARAEASIRTARAAFSERCLASPLGVAS